MRSTTTNTSTTGGRGRQGFASMTPEQRSQIASQGGIAAHLKGTAHKYTSEEAREAGRKGGLVRAARYAAKQAE